MGQFSLLSLELAKLRLNTMGIQIPDQSGTFMVDIVGMLNCPVFNSKKIASKRLLLLTVLYITNKKLSNGLD